MKHSLQDAYIYDLLDLNQTVAAIGSKITPNIDNYKISKDQLAAIVNDFKYKATGYGKERIISLIESGKLIFVEAPGIQLPAWCTQGPNGIVCVCNLFGKVRKGREGNIVYQVKEIFGLAVVGYVIRSFYVNEKRIMFSNQLITLIGGFYTKMILRLLDIMFAISSHPGHVEFNGIAFVTARFFLRRVMEKESSIDQEVNNISSILRPINPAFGSSVQLVLDTVKDFPEDSYTSIDKFVKALAAYFPMLNRLEVNLLIRKMITLYGEKSVLMLESPQYLLAYSVSSMYSANLIKDFQMMSILGNQDGAKLVSTFFGLDSDPGN